MEAATIFREDDLPLVACRGMLFSDENPHLAGIIFQQGEISIVRKCMNIDVHQMLPSEFSFNVYTIRSIRSI
jgi:hypothetical protein